MKCLGVMYTFTGDMGDTDKNTEKCTKTGQIQTLLDVSINTLNSEQSNFLLGMKLLFCISTLNIQ